MIMRRPIFAQPVASFGRRPPPIVLCDERRDSIGLADDFRLFALTFAGGFLFVSVYLA